ncbi:MAG: outer membrane beta-barrel protein [Deltaproteobacteria bacterium]|nr:outer membrane beta-barrel protein [Deltaproteobacteria bacterium]
MLARVFCMIAFTSVTTSAVAQESPPADGRADAPSTDLGLQPGGTAQGPVLTPFGPDALHRDAAATPTAADAAQHPGADAALVGGSSAAVITGGAGAALPPGLLPEGTNPAAPILADPTPPAASAPAAAGLRFWLAGFADVGLNVTVFDSKNFENYDTTFLPRQVEVDLGAGWKDAGGARLDLNVLTSPESRPISVVSPPLDRDLMDALVEQALVEWRPFALTLRAGKMNRPHMNEPLDPVDRVSLSRSSLTVLALPDSLTGVYLGYEPLAMLEIYALVANGWNTTVEAQNRSKAAGGGVAHRFGELAHGHWLYSGNLSCVIGAERPFVNDLRWVLDYSGKIGVADEFDLALEAVYGQEQNQGYSAEGIKDGDSAAVWYGGTLAASYRADAASGLLAGSSADLRLEYLHDPDLLLDLPREGSLPYLTTLVGVSATLRYALTPGIEVGAEYRADFERGDVDKVSVQRNKSDNIFTWYITQEMMLELIGRF